MNGPADNFISPCASCYSTASSHPKERDKANYSLQSGRKGELQRVEAEERAGDAIVFAGRDTWWAWLNLTQLICRRDQGRQGPNVDYGKVE